MEYAWGQSKQYDVKKGPTIWQGLSIFSSFVVQLDRGYVGRTWAFFALSNLKLNALVFIERCIAICLNLRVMDKQIIATVIRSNKTKTLT